MMTDRRSVFWLFWGWCIETWPPTPWSLRCPQYHHPAWSHHDYTTQPHPSHSIRH